jgi:hypothetical protein
MCDQHILPCGITVFFLVHRGDSASIYTFELTDKHKVHSYKTTWDSYLDSLKHNKSGESVSGMIIFHPLSCLHKAE